MFILLLWPSRSFSNVYLVIKSEAQHWNKRWCLPECWRGYFYGAQTKDLNKMDDLFLFHVNVWTSGQFKVTLLHVVIQISQFLWSCFTICMLEHSYGWTWITAPCPHSSCGKGEESGRCAIFLLKTPCRI